MTATSVKAPKKKKHNFQVKRRAVADSKICSKPVVRKLLKQKDALIASLQDQLDAKQQDGTKRMNKLHALSLQAKQQQADLDTLRTRLTQAEEGERAARQRLTKVEQGERAAQRAADKARTELQASHEKYESLTRQNKALHQIEFG